MGYKHAPLVGNTRTNTNNYHPMERRLIAKIKNATRPVECQNDILYRFLIFSIAPEVMGRKIEQRRDRHSNE